jgi:molybdopterin synthase catalytic subunit
LTVTVRVQEADFDVGAELAALRDGDARIGALASFVGLVRDVNHGVGVSEMTLEHYPGMTEKALAAIVAEAKRVGTSTLRWSSIASGRFGRATRSCWSP